MTRDRLDRRGFLGLCAGLLSAAIAKPSPIFVPPREPYVHLGYALDGLYSNLGVLPCSRELGTCEGRLLEIRDWDGVGYPCLVENVCVGDPKPRAVVYDFDLWNSRHDDDLRREMGIKSYNAEIMRYNCLAAWYAHRRFGNDAVDIIQQGGGWLINRVDRFPMKAPSLVPMPWETDDA